MNHGAKKGQRTFNFSFVVSDDKEKEWDEAFASHGAWMRETHSLTGGIHLVDYYISKGTQMNNSLDPSEGTSGNLIYTLNEVYVEREGTSQHMEAAPSWKSFESFLELIGSSEAVMLMDRELIQSME